MDDVPLPLTVWCNPLKLCHETRPGPGDSGRSELAGWCPVLCPVQRCVADDGILRVQLNGIKQLTQLRIEGVCLGTFRL